MNEKEYRKIIASNIRRIAYDQHKSQADISRDLGINKATISSWMNGTRMPKMEKIDLLCEYFGCKRIDIMEAYKEYLKTPQSARTELAKLSQEADYDNVDMVLKLLKKLEDSK